VTVTTIVVVVLATAVDVVRVVVVEFDAVVTVVSVVDVVPVVDVVVVVSAGQLVNVKTVELGTMDVKVTTVLGWPVVMTVVTLQGKGGTQHAHGLGGGGRMAGYGTGQPMQGRSGNWQPPPIC
jgi:hypothetical protein